MFAIDKLWIVVAEGNIQTEIVSTRKMVTMNDAQEPYENYEDLLGENIVIAQNDTYFPVTTFPWFRCMSTLPWRHFMKVNEKEPILEDPYLGLYNSILPLLCTYGKVSKSDKNF